LNKWLTLGANIGVLIGLALLILEINQNNELMLAQMEQSRSMSLVDFRRQAAMNPEFSALMAKAIQLTESGIPLQKIDEHLTPGEISQLDALATADIYDMENVFAQYERGLISDEYWQERMVPAIRVRAKLWKARTSLLDGPGAGTRQTFQDEVKRIMQMSSEAGSP
jgi:hypothetical protein